MAPVKGQRNATQAVVSLSSLANKEISTRTQNVQENVAPVITRGKRKADNNNSPLKNDKIKRSALGNLTNNVINLHLDEDKKKKSTNDCSNISKSTENLYNGKKTVNVIKTKISNFFSTQSKNIPGVQHEILSSKSKNLRGNKMVTRASKAKGKNDSGSGLVVPLAAIHNQLKKQQQQEQQQKPSQQIKAKECYEVVQQQQKHNKDLENESIFKNDLSEDQTVQVMEAPKNIPIRRASIDAKCRRISNEFEKTEDTLYMSALEELPLSGESLRLSGQFDQKRKSLIDIPLLVSVKEEEYNKNRISTPSPLKKSEPEAPVGVEDFDKENWNDPFQISYYAKDIFNYMKQREGQFSLDDYMEKQIHLTKWMRSLLVDWMVEVQETFELNHETLYLAVKLVDMYLSKSNVLVQKDKLQLLGAVSLFIACKFDERTPPLVEDFLYICDGAYTHKELIKMEMVVLKKIEYDLGIPLSYRFLRRYARCDKVPMPTLTLARYILEFSLMDYTIINLSDSQLACAALFMALKMKDSDKEASPWNKTLEYFTGYRVCDFAYIIPILNAGLKRKPKDAIKTIRNKYSHKIFFEVSKIPLLTNEKILENTGLLGEDQNKSTIY